MDTGQSLRLQGITQFPWMIFSPVAKVSELDLELQVRHQMESNHPQHRSSTYETATVNDGCLIGHILFHIRAEICAAQDLNCTLSLAGKKQPAVFLVVLPDWTTLLPICHKQSINLFYSLPFRARCCFQHSCQTVFERKCQDIVGLESMLSPSPMYLLRHMGTSKPSEMSHYLWGCEAPACNYKL